MPRRTKTRKPVRLLPHKHTSGLFLRDGEDIADIKPDAGGRTIRTLGNDRDRALTLFDDLVAKLSNGGENPLLTELLVATFPPTQRRLKAYAFNEHAIQGVVRFIQSTEPGLRVRELRRHYVERLRTHYDGFGYAPRTISKFTQKLSQALDHAVDLGLLDANPLARVKPLTVDNRRTRFLSMNDVVRILAASHGSEAHYARLESP